jgi:sterol desaturase/sphingolipid hydroxylase (fatty acid hydroxylase superfamily)
MTSLLGVRRLVLYLLMWCGLEHGMLISKFEKDALLITVLVLLFVLECLFPYFDTFKNKTRHTMRNLGLIVFNAIVVSVVLTPVVVGSLNTSWGVFNRWDLHWMLEFGLTVLLVDFLTYVLHVMYHKVPFLWRFHRVHHSDVAMGVITGARFHVGEHILSTLVKCGLYACFAMKLEYVLVYEAIFISNVFFHHANISIGESWDRIYRIFLTSPNMHKVHHSDIQIETDSNYTSLFSIWDRIGRTFRLVENSKDIVFGIKGMEDEQTVVRMLTTPFRDIETK